MSDIKPIGSYRKCIVVFDKDISVSTSNVIDSTTKYVVSKIIKDVQCEDSMMDKVICSDTDSYYVCVGCLDGDKFEDRLFSKATKLLNEYIYDILGYGLKGIDKDNVSSQTTAPSPDIEQQVLHKKTPISYPYHMLTKELCGKMLDDDLNNMVIDFSEVCRLLWLYMDKNIPITTYQQSVESFKKKWFNSSYIFNNGSHNKMLDIIDRHTEANDYIIKKYKGTEIFYSQLTHLPLSYFKRTHIPAVAAMIEYCDMNPYDPVFESMRTCFSEDDINYFDRFLNRIICFDDDDYYDRLLRIITNLGRYEYRITYKLDSAKILLNKKGNE